MGSFMTTLMTLFGLALVSTLTTASVTSTTRLKIAIIDTGLNVYDPRFQDFLCPTGHKDFTGAGLSDTNGHGTHVAGILMRAAPDHSKYCVVIIKIGSSVRQELKAFVYAESLGVKVVNFSWSNTAVVDQEFELMRSSKMLFVVAAGNNKTYYREAYPGGYQLPNVIPVGNWDCQSKTRGPASNYGEGVNWRCGTNIKSTLPDAREGYMSGTSQATPLMTAEIINRLTKED